MKRFFTSILLLLTTLSTFAQRPKVGVVLCGGGAKGAAHVGVLKVLEENDIPIDYIVGTSMGAIVGGLYAIGYSAAELDSLIMAQDWSYMMSDRIPRRDTYFEQRKYQDNYLIRIPFGSGDYSRLGPRPQLRRNEGGSLLDNIPLAVVNGQNIYNLFTRLSVGYQDSLDFTRMPVPFACVAVDLISKKEVVFKSGHFVDAIRASMAIPGYFSPVRIDDMVLIDGGALNNYPVDVAREMGADIIIGVKLGELEKEDPAVNSIGDLFSQVLELYMDAKSPDALASTDILVSPSVKGYNTLSFDTRSLRTLIDNGEAAAREKQEELTRLKDRLNCSRQQFIGPEKPPERYHKAVRLDRDSVTIAHISFNGLTAQDAQWLFRKSPLKAGARISGKTLDDEVARFYNTAAFASVTYQLKGRSDPYDLQMNFAGGRKSGFGAGFRFDNEEIATILLGVGINENALYGSKLSLTARLTYNMQAELQYSYAFKSLAQFKMTYHFRASDLNIMNVGLRSNMTFKAHTVKAAFSTVKARDIAIDLGTQLDLFRYKSLLTEAETLPTYDTDLKRNLFLSGFARFQIDRRDQEDFPRRGSHFDGSFHYYFNRFFGEYSDFSAVKLHASAVIPIGQRFAFILSLDNRTLLGSNVPLVYANMMGGSLAGRYLDQQIPFIGFGYTHVFQNVLSIATLDLRYRMLDNHYLFTSGACSFNFQGLEDLFEPESAVGFRIGYAYNSFIGPVAFNLFWSDYTKRPGASISIGYNF